MASNGVILAPYVRWMVASPILHWSTSRMERCKRYLVDDDPILSLNTCLLNQWIKGVR